MSENIPSGFENTPGAESGMLFQDKILITKTASGKLTCEVRIGTNSLRDPAQARDVINRQVAIFEMLAARFPDLKVTTQGSDFVGASEIEKRLKGDE